MVRDAVESGLVDSYAVGGQVYVEQGDILTWLRNESLHSNGHRGPGA
jgi:hypothetical protein